MENHHTHHHGTHWHSFWYGFMVALATILMCLLILTITEHISFDVPPKKSALTTHVPTDNKNSQEPEIATIVTDLGIDADMIRTCVQEKKYADKVQAHIDSGTRAKVKGTPHSFVLIDQAIYEIPGAYDEKGMREFFDDLLANKTPKATDISDRITLDQVTDTDWIMGKDNARITVVIYSDMDCPYCKKFHTSISNMMPDYSDTVRWIYRHMPVDSLHPQSREKAETAECIGAIGGTEKFWQFLYIMYQQDERD